jgi:hypothetical protein
MKGTHLSELEPLCSVAEKRGVGEVLMSTGERIATDSNSSLGLNYFLILYVQSGLGG